MLNYQRVKAYHLYFLRERTHSMSPPRHPSGPPSRRNVPGEFHETRQLRQTLQSQTWLDNPMMTIQRSFESDKNIELNAMMTPESNYKKKTW